MARLPRRTHGITPSWVSLARRPSPMPSAAAASLGRRDRESLRLDLNEESDVPLVVERSTMTLPSVPREGKRPWLASTLNLFPENRRRARPDPRSPFCGLENGPQPSRSDLLDVHARKITD